MFHLLRVTAFNLPRTTRLVGVLLSLAIGVINLCAAAHPGVPGYASALLIAAAAGSFLAAIGLAVGIRAPGWRLAVTVSALCTAAYLVSRTAGLPGFRETVGDWHNPLGTLGLLIEALLAAIYISLRVGWNVDAPEQRDWDTYFSRPAPADEGVPRAS